MIKNTESKPNLPSPERHPSEPSSSGRISFRTKSKVHYELMWVAQTLGIDMSALINQIIADQLPVYAAKAVRLARAREIWRKEGPAGDWGDQKCEAWVGTLHAYGLDFDEISRMMNTDVETVKRRHRSFQKMQQALSPESKTKE